MKIIPLLLLCLLVVVTPILAASNDKLYHDISIANILINEQSLHCGKEVLVTVDVVNAGTFTEDVYIELMNNPLEVHAFSAPAQAQPRSREQVLIPLYFAEEPQGTYTFTAYLYAHKTIEEAFQTVTFTGCKTVKLTTYIQDQPPSFIPPSSSPSHDEEPINVLFASTLFILVLLVLLACAAIVRHL